jgi:hypothetical protein
MLPSLPPVKRVGDVESFSWFNVGSNSKSPVLDGLDLGFVKDGIRYGKVA